MASVWLAHVTVYDVGLAAEKVLYFSSSAYTSGASNYPASGAAHTYYDPRIKQPALMRRDIFDAAKTYGASRVGFGLMDLVNIDGALDEMLVYGIDGRKIEIILGTVTMGGTPTWTTVFSGTMEQPEIGWDKVSLRLRDRQFELAVPISKNMYGGTNSLPNGLDGVQDDLKGKNKPILLGQVFNIQPPLVNTSRLIYQVNDGAIASVDAVYDRGAALTKGADYTSQSDMETNAPAAGNYRAWPGGGYFRLGSSPTGMITADVTQGANAAARTVAQLVQTAVVTYTTVAAGDITSADIITLDSLNSGVVGIYVDNADTVSTVLDTLCASVGAWYGFDNLGKFRIARLTAPAAPEAINVISADIIKIDRTASQDPGKGVPCWKVSYSYKKFYATQPSDLAGTVTADRRAVLAAQYRTITVSNSAIQTKHKLATVMEITGQFVSASDASTEANRLLTLYSADRSVYTLRLSIDALALNTLDLGAIVALTLPRFNMSGGAYFMIIGIKPDYRLKIVDLTLWG